MKDIGTIIWTNICNDGFTSIYENIDYFSVNKIFSRTENEIEPMLPIIYLPIYTDTYESIK